MVQRYTLKSGIPLFVVKNEAAPVVSIQAWVARGSAHEPDKLAGISHFIEHALFKGTKKRKVGQIALEIESWGGEVNAYTSFEETVYYTTLASRFFEKGLDVISDAVQNAIFDKTEMDREREVILEEIKRAYDSSAKMVFTNLWGKAFPKTPYGRPVLGFEKTVGKFSAATLKQYYKDNYHAGTFSLVFVGDIDPTKAYKLAEQKFARVRKVPRKSASKKIKFHAPSSQPVALLAKDVQECQMQIGFRAPSITDPSIPALDLLCSAIGNGESSRLYQTLVKEKRIALDAQMGLVATDRCGMVTLSLLTAPENLLEATQEVKKVLTNVAESGLSQEELDRVKNAMEAETVYGKQTVEGHARRLGYYHMHFGDPEFEKRYQEMIEEVTLAQVHEALRQTLKVRPLFSLVHPLKTEIDRKKLVDTFKFSKVAPLEKTKLHEGPEKKEHQGATLIWKQNKVLPLTSLRFIFYGGGAREEQTHNLGASNLFSTLWTSGTESYSSFEMAKALEEIGASVSGFSGKNTCGLSVDFLSKHWHRIQPILSEVLFAPSFPEEEFTTERDLVLREIEALSDSPAQMCQLNFLKKLYAHTRHSYPALGTRETVTSLSTDTLKQWYRDYIHRGRLAVSTVGDFAPDSWLEEIGTLVSELRPRGKEALPEMHLTPPESVQVISQSKTPLFQSHILVGFLGANLNSEDRYAMRLLSSCLAGQGGRLFLELRDKQSLAYTVAPLNSESVERGAFAFYIGCSPEKWQTSITGIRKELEKILAKPIGNKELARAKQYLIGRFEMDLQRNSTQATLYALDELYGHGYDHALHYSDKIQSVSATDLQSAAQKYLDPSRAVLSIVHPQTLDESAVLKAWGMLAGSRSAPSPSQAHSASL